MAQALTAPFRWPPSGPNEIGRAFHRASIQQGEPEASICQIKNIIERKLDRCHKKMHRKNGFPVHDC